MRYRLPAKAPVVDPEFRGVKEPTSNQHLLERIRAAKKNPQPITDVITDSNTVRGCLSKSQFATIDEARSVAARYRKLHGVATKPYQCATCRCFHLTKKGAK
jgi:hypothetical protein